MKFTLNWLADHLETTATLSEIVEALIQLGIEVESVETPSDRLRGFVVAEVVKTEPHPNADRLTICQVKDGSGPLLQVVCGAPNVKADIKVSLARVGTIIPATGTALKASVIRGISSQGMLCSAEELLLSQPSQGILELHTDLPAGSELAAALGLDDSVIDVSITPNRSDCFSVRGLARDLAALGVGKLKTTPLPSLSFEHDCPVPLTVLDPACTYFAGRTVTGIKNNESPAWLKKRLQAIGQRTISAVVDITNYVCLDRGQPLHAFDADKIQGSLTVSPASAGEKFTALNQETYTLASGMTTVRDDTGVLSLAGIMGGHNSACDSSTTRVFLESAYFDSVSIAKTGQALNLHSDSRTRFERGVDPQAVLDSLNYATDLIVHYCGGKASSVIEVGKVQTNALSITLSQTKLTTISGDPTLLLQDTIPFLKKLGLQVISQSDSLLTVSPPSWRHDLKLDVDVIEEILRLKGYDHIPALSLPLKLLSHPANTSTLIRRRVCQRGLDEVYTWSFIDSQSAALFGQGVALAVPLSQEMAVLRPSMLPGLLRSIATNQSKSQTNSAFFELAAIFQAQEDQPLEETCVAGVRSQQFSLRHWAGSDRLVDVFDAKADAEAVLEALSIQSYQVEAVGPDYYHPVRKGAFKQGPKVLGFFGEIHPQVLAPFKVDGPVVAFEIFTDRLPNLSAKRPLPLLKLSPYQAVTRDFAFIVADELTADVFLKTLQKADKTLIQSIRIFDIYKGDKLEAGKKSLGVEIRLQALDRTLTEDDLNQFSQRVIDLVEKNCQGILRTSV